MQSLLRSKNNSQSFNNTNLKDSLVHVSDNQPHPNTLPTISSMAIKTFLKYRHFILVKNHKLHHSRHKYPKLLSHKSNPRHKARPVISATLNQSLLLLPSSQFNKRLLCLNPQNRQRRARSRCSGKRWDSKNSQNSKIFPTILFLKFLRKTWTKPKVCATKTCPRLRNMKIIMAARRLILALWNKLCCSRVWERIIFQLARSSKIVKFKKIKTPNLIHSLLNPKSSKTR